MPLPWDVHYIMWQMACIIIKGNQGKVMDQLSYNVTHASTRISISLGEAAPWMYLVGDNDWKVGLRQHTHNSSMLKVIDLQLDTVLLMYLYHWVNTSESNMILLITLLIRHQWYGKCKQKVQLEFTELYCPIYFLSIHLNTKKTKKNNNSGFR